MGTEQDPGLVVLLTRLSKAIYRRSTDAMLGMSLKEFSALSYLREGGVPQHMLAEALHLDENNLVLLLNELEANELATRHRDPEDRRRHIVEITPRGRRALERAERGMESVEDDVLAALNASERATLKRLVRQALTAKVPARS
jgi:DNA-binding MarR family transcriptional regulator